MASRWTTVKAAAQRLNVSRDTIEGLVKKKRLTSRREGRAIRIDVTSLDAYERATTTPAKPSVVAVRAVSERREFRQPLTDEEARQILYGRKPRRPRAPRART